MRKKVCDRRLILKTKKKRKVWSSKNIVFKKDKADWLNF